MTGWLQGQNSVMHLYVAQRVANQLDTEIRALSRKLPERMTAGLRGRRCEFGSCPACLLPSLQGFATLEDNPPLPGKPEQYSLGEALHSALRRLISFTQSCSHLAGVEKPVGMRRKVKPEHREGGPLIGKASRPCQYIL